MTILGSLFGMSGEDIYHNFRGGTGDDAKGIISAGLIVQRLTKNYELRGDSIMDLTSKMEGAWQGDAAGAARRGAGPLAVEHKLASPEVTTARTTLNDQADAFISAKGGVVEVPKRPEEPGFWKNFLSGGEANANYESQMTQYNAANDHNVAIMDVYEGATETNTSSMPTSYGRITPDYSAVGVLPPKPPPPGKPWEPPDNPRDPGDNDSNTNTNNNFNNNQNQNQTQTPNTNDPNQTDPNNSRPTDPSQNRPVPGEPPGRVPGPGPGGPNNQNPGGPGYPGMLPPTTGGFGPTGGGSSTGARGPGSGGFGGRGGGGFGPGGSGGAGTEARTEFLRLGLLDNRGRMDVEAASSLAVLCRAGAEFYGWISDGERTRGVLAGAIGREAVLAVRDGDQVSVTQIRPETLPMALVSQTPDVPPARGETVNVLRSEVLASTGGRQRTEAGVGSRPAPPEVRIVQQIIAQETKGGGELYVAVRDRLGRRRPVAEPLRYADTVNGRWLNYMTRSSDGEDRVLVKPATKSDLAGRLQDMHRSLAG